MRVAVQKIEGVERVEVSLNQGLADVRFHPDNRATIEQVREAIRRNGFTPKAAQVRVQGQLTDVAGKLTLTVPGQNRAYHLVGHPEAAGALGKTVLVEGSVGETTRGETVDTIEVRTWSIVSPPQRPSGHHDADHHRRN